MFNELETFYSSYCRTLITKALRKKQFHKEIIKVEPAISSGEQVDSNKSWSSDLFKWDPISSGEGDLLLDDLAKSFAASSEVSKKAKPIDFTSIIGGMPSHGFRVKDLISRTQVTPQSPDNNENFNIIGKSTGLPSTSDGNLEQERHDKLDLPEPGLTPVHKVPSKLQALENQNSQILFSCDTTNALSDAGDIGVPMTTMEAESNNPSLSTVNVDLIGKQIQDSQSRKSVNNFESPVSLPNEKGTVSTDEIVLDSASHVDSKVEAFTPSKDSSISAPNEEENLRSSRTTPESVGNDLMEEDSTDVDTENQEASSPLINFALHEKYTDKEQFEESEHVPLVLTDHTPPESDTVIVEHDPLVANTGPPDVAMEDQKHGIADTESDQLTLCQSSTSGNTKAKRKVPRQAMMLPLKRRLSSPFKKPHRRSRSKTR